MSVFYDPVRFRTLARFSAPDPWSENQIADYSLEEYVMMPPGSTRAVENGWNLHAIGIRWEGDLRYRLLPESLVELWKHGRVQLERLPGLLHAMEPRILETDCTLSQSWRKSTLLPMLMLLVVGPAVCLLIRVNGESMPIAGAIAMGFAIVLLTGFILWTVRSMKRRRLQEQIKWALQQVSGSSDVATHAPFESPFMTYFKLWLKLFATFVVLAVLAVGGAVIYFRFYA
jgi:hypothetical protein